jgi:hypothetical protein
VLAVAALLLGWFLAPVVTPVLGVLLMRGSPHWSRGVKRVATVLGLVPPALVLVVIAAFAVGVVREPSHLLLGLVAIVVSHVAPFVAGLLLAGTRRAVRPVPA